MIFFILSALLKLSERSFCACALNCKTALRTIGQIYFMVCIMLYHKNKKPTAVGLYKQHRIITPSTANSPPKI